MRPCVSNNTYEYIFILTFSKSSSKNVTRENDGDTDKTQFVASLSGSNKAGYFKGASRET